LLQGEHAIDDFFPAGRHATGGPVQHCISIRAADVYFHARKTAVFRVLLLGDLAVKGVGPCGVVEIR
jgi:hypothetical protein